MPGGDTGRGQTMKTYKTTSPVYLFAGEIALDDSQAKPRLESGLIKPTETEGVYRITKEICFRAGEVIGLGNPDLATLKKLDPVEDVPEKFEQVEKKPGRKPMSKHL